MHSDTKAAGFGLVTFSVAQPVVIRAAMSQHVTRTSVFPNAQRPASAAPLNGVGCAPQLGVTNRRPPAEPVVRGAAQVAL